MSRQVFGWQLASSQYHTTHVKIWDMAALHVVMENGELAIWNLKSRGPEGSHSTTGPAPARFASDTELPAKQMTGKDTLSGSPTMGCLPLTTEAKEEQSSSGAKAVKYLKSWRSPAVISRRWPPVRHRSSWMQARTAVKSVSGGSTRTMKRTRWRNRSSECPRALPLFI